MEPQINPIVTLIPLIVIALLPAIVGLLIAKKKVGVVKDCSFPKVWPGYVLAVLFLIFNIGEAILNPRSNQDGYSSWNLLIGLSGFIYWLVCVYNLHKAVLFITDSRYPISPGQAAGHHLFLFYNVYWIFKWPGEIVNMINKRTNSSRLKPWLPGLILLLSAILSRTLGGFVWLLGYFWTIGYLIRVIKTNLVTNPESTA